MSKDEIRGTTENAAIIDDTSIVAEETVTVSETVTEQSEVATESDPVGDLELTEEDMKDIVPIVYDKARLSDKIIEGYSVPEFNPNDRKVLRDNLNIDPSVIDSQINIMREVVETIKVVREEEGLEVDVSDKINVFNSTYNLLITYQQSIDGFNEFLKQHREQIMSVIDADGSKVIDAYTKAMSEKYGIEYVPGTLRKFLEAIALKKLIAEEVEDNMVRVFIPENAKNSKRAEFDDVVIDIMKSMTYFITSVSDNREIDRAGYEERSLSTIATAVIKEFSTIPMTYCDTLDVEVNAKKLLSSHIVNLAYLIGKKSQYEWMKLKSIYNKELRQYRQKLTKQGVSKENVKEAFLSVNTKTSKARFHAAITELTMKRWFAFLMFGDASLMNDSDKFFASLNDTTKYTTRKVYGAIVASFAYRFLFDELANILQYTSIIPRHLNSKDMDILKNYISFVGLEKFSKEIKADEDTYKINELYNEYLAKLRETLIFKA